MDDWNQRWLASIERNLKRAQDRKIISSGIPGDQYIDEIYLIALLTVERDQRREMIAADRAEREAA